MKRAGGRYAQAKMTGYHAYDFTEANEMLSLAETPWHIPHSGIWCLDRAGRGRLRVPHRITFAV